MMKKIRDWLGTILLIILIFLFKSIFYSNANVPTPSLHPNIMPGDLLLVNKYHYQTDINLRDFIRIPAYLLREIFNIKYKYDDGFFGEKLIFKKNNKPKYGDIIVFEKPKDPLVLYVKRLIGMPGDLIKIKGHDVWINNQKLNKVEILDNKKLELKTYFKYERKRKRKFYKENLAGKEYIVTYEKINQKEKTFKVPVGHYFFMGDNRDQSNDSRHWGFVKENAIQGKVSTVLFHFRLEPTDNKEQWFPDIIFYNRTGMSL